MKVLLVSNMYPSQKYPHYGVFVENAENVLRKLENITVDRVVLNKRDGKLSKLLGYLSFYINILRKGLFGSYDVIYGHFLSHIALPLRVVKTLRPKVKLVLNAHGNDVVADCASDNKWVMLSRKIVPSAAYVIVPSGYYKTVMREEFGVAEEKLLVYPSGGVNTQVFCAQDRQTLLPEYGLDPAMRYVGYISRIETDKGWDIFLQMVAALKDEPQLGFLVVGGGAQQGEFDALAQQLGISDRLIRYPLLSQKKIAEIFNILDVFCFPTRRKSESLGLVGLEAMACGCLVVASSAGGPSSYMKDGENGFVFSPDSVEEMIHKVRAALSMTEEEKQTIMAGMKQTTQEYCNETVDRILLDFFAGLN